MSAFDVMLAGSATLALAYGLDAALAAYRQHRRSRRNRV